MATYAVWQRWRFDLRWCYARPVLAGHRHLATWDLGFTVWRLRAGEVRVEHDGGRFDAAAGDLVLIPPGLRRRHRFSDDADLASLRLEILDAGGQPVGVGQPPLRLAAAPELAAAIAGLHAAIGPDRLPEGDWIHAPLTPAHWAAIQGGAVAVGVALLTASGAAAARTTDARVTRAQAVLSARLTPAALPWRELRAATGLARAQLDRLFRAHLGQSVRGWADDRLLAAACTALQDPADPVKAIAARLGFGDASHFCRWFRHRTGASPMAWRQAPAT